MENFYIPINVNAKEWKILIGCSIPLLKFYQFINSFKRFSNSFIGLYIAIPMLVPLKTSGFSLVPFLKYFFEFLFVFLKYFFGG